MKKQFKIYIQDISKILFNKQIPFLFENEKYGFSIKFLYKHKIYNIYISQIKNQFTLARFKGFYQFFTFEKFIKLLIERLKNE